MRAGRGGAGQGWCGVSDVGCPSRASSVVCGREGAPGFFQEQREGVATGAISFIIHLIDVFDRSRAVGSPLQQERVWVQWTLGATPATQRPLHPDCACTAISPWNACNQRRLQSTPSVLCILRDNQLQELLGDAIALPLRDEYDTIIKSRQMKPQRIWPQGVSKCPQYSSMSTSFLQLLAAVDLPRFVGRMPLQHADTSAVRQQCRNAGVSFQPRTNDVCMGRHHFARCADRIPLLRTKRLVRHILTAYGSLDSAMQGGGGSRPEEAAQLQRSSSSKNSGSSDEYGRRDETCPDSTEGGTRRVRIVRKEGRDVSS
jgi:hypothetical protein